MTDTSLVDPLRTFEMDDAGWKKIVRLVEAEGFDDWHNFAPQMVAAIQLGYMDAHLQMLGKVLRERYFHLKDPDGNPAPEYMPAEDTASAGSAMNIGAYLVANPDIKFVPSDGITPEQKVWDNSESVPRDKFKARGWRFNKSDFVDLHFEATLGVIGCKGLYRIESAGATKFAVMLVAVDDAKKQGRVGRLYNFDMEKQKHWYNLPPTS